MFGSVREEVVEETSLSRPLAAGKAALRRCGVRDACRHGGQLSEAASAFHQLNGLLARLARTRGPGATRETSEEKTLCSLC